MTVFKKGNWVSWETKRDGRTITVTGEVVSCYEGKLNVRQHDCGTATAWRTIRAERATLMPEDPDEGFEEVDPSLAYVAQKATRKRKFFGC